MLGILIGLNVVVLIAFFYIRAKLYDIFRRITMLFMVLTLAARIVLFVYYELSDFPINNHPINHFKFYEFFLIFAPYTFFAVSIQAHLFKWVVLVLYTYSKVSTTEPRIRKRERLIEGAMWLLVFWQILVLLICTFCTKNLDPHSDASSTYVFFQYNVIITYLLLMMMMLGCLVWFLYRVYKLLPFIYHEIKMKLMALFSVFFLVLVLRETFYVLDFAVWVHGHYGQHSADTVMLFISYFSELLPPFIMVFSIKNIDEISPDQPIGSFLSGSREQVALAASSYSKDPSSLPLVEADSGGAQKTISEQTFSLLNDFRGEDIKISISEYAKKPSFKTGDSSSGASSNNFT